MMEYDELDLDEDQIARVSVQLEFYLKRRQDSIPVVMKLPIKKGVITSVSQLMDLSYQQIMTDIDSKSVHCLTLEDHDHNHFSILTKEVQAFNIMAPASLPEGFEEDE